MFGVVVGVLSLACGGVAWEGEAFSTPVEAVQAVASQAGARDGVTTLFRSLRWSLDEERRVRRVYRDVVRLQGARAIERWSTASFRFAPALELPPEVRARVVTPEGRVYQLTQDMVSYAFAAPEAGEVSDQRLVSAALPGLRTGVVVELEVTFLSRPPRFQSPLSGRFVVDEPLEGDMWLVIEAPRDVPLTLASRRLALSRRDEDAGGRRRIVLRGSRLEVASGQGDVTWSTARSWQEVARGYGVVLADARKGRPAVDARALVAGAATRQEKAQKVLDWLRGEVRYTGLHFGDRGIVPWSPAEVLQRGFGDCKDLSLLVVEVLAAAGVEARLALLDTKGTVDDGVPTFAFFDHAIVVLPATKTEPALWMDPTLPQLPAGRLPSAYAGELALVVDDTSTGLVPTRALSSADTKRALQLDVELPAYGAGTVTVTERLTGAFAVGVRLGVDRDGDAWLPAELEALAESLSLEGLEPTLAPSRVVTEPAVYGGRARRAPDFFVNWSDAELQLPERELVSWVPEALLGEVPPPLADGRFRVRVPHVTTLALNVRLPPGFEVVELPAARTERWGPATLTSSSSVKSGGQVEVTLTFDTGARDYSAGDVAAFRAAYRRWREAPATTLRLVFGASRIDPETQLRELAEWYARARAAHPGDVGLEAHYAFDLLQFGLGAAARERSRQLVMAQPSSAMAWASRGWILSHDSLGRELRGDFDRRGAIAALERAVELEPACDFCVERLAFLERYDDEGRWLSASLDRGRAQKAFARAWPADRSSDPWVNLMVQCEQWAALREALQAPSTETQVAAALLAEQMLAGAPASWARWKGRVEGALLTKAKHLVLFWHLAAKRHAEAGAFAAVADIDRSLPAFAASRAARAPGAPQAEVLASYDAFALALLAPAGPAREAFVRDSLVEVPGGPAAEAWLSTRASEWRRLDAARELSASAAQAGLLLLPLVVEEGPRDGRRVRVPGTDPREAVYLVRRGKGWRVLAASGSAALAAWALQRFEEHRDVDAEAWLRWALECFAREDVGLYGEEVRSLRQWGMPDSRLVAAALAPHRPEARRLLEAALRSATLSTKSELLRLLVVGAALDGDREASRRWSAALAAHAPTAQSTFAWRLWERWKARDLEGQREVVEAWRARYPESPRGLCEAARVELQSGRGAAALALHRQLLALPAATDSDFEQAAWSALVTGELTAETLAWARRGVGVPGGIWRDEETLALHLASRGEALHEAVQLTRRLVDGAPASLPNLVLGRVAEAVGLRAEARALYESRVMVDARPGTTEALAAQWLERLEVGGAAR